MNERTSACRRMVGGWVGRSVGRGLRQREAGQRGLRSVCLSVGRSRQSKASREVVVRCFVSLWLSSYFVWFDRASVRPTYVRALRCVRACPALPCVRSFACFVRSCVRACVRSFVHCVRSLQRSLVRSFVCFARCSPSFACVRACVSD